MRGLRSRKLISPEGRVSRGNKFRQIVLPALYTVMKSSGPCLPSPTGHSVRSVSSFPACRYRRFGVPMWIRAPPVIAGEGDMRLVPPERKRCHFLPAVFLAPALVLLPLPLFSRPCSFDTLARYQPLFSIFCERTSDFLIAIDVHSRLIAATLYRRTCMQ